jgi:hypothetical protein
MSAVIAVEPFWDKLQEHHAEHGGDTDFWDWLSADYGGFQVYIKSNPTALGEKDACGLWFESEEEATLFTLKWS